MNPEASDFRTNRIELEPRRLLCLACLRGGGQEIPEQPMIRELADRLAAQPDLHITLVGAFDEIGARTERFERQTPAERRKDLDVLQRLGLCFGDTRTARDLIARIHERIPTLQDICAYLPNPYGSWAECPLARTDHFAAGNLPLPMAQLPDAMAAQKQRSVTQMMQSDHIEIRAHHLLCIVCFAGRPDHDQPLAEDNLYEAWVRFRENPDIPVTILEGASRCCICPPCYGFEPERGLCVSACHLRDRKKDLDTCVALGINPGLTYPARELYRRIRERLPQPDFVCGYAQDTSPEWTSCSGVTDGRYAAGLARFGV